MASQSSGSSWQQWVRGRADAPDDELSLDDASFDDDEFGVVDEDWESASAGASPTGDDEFGIELRWPRSNSNLAPSRPASTPEADTGPGPLEDDAPPRSVGPLLPFLVNRVDALQETVAAVEARFDAQEESIAKLFDVLAARVDRLTTAVDTVARRDIAASVDLIPLVTRLEQLGSAVDAVRGRDVAASADLAPLAPASMVEGLAVDMAEAVDVIRTDVSQLRDELAQARDELSQLRRRIPLRAKREEAAFDPAELSERVADIVLQRLLAVVEVAPFEEPAPPVPEKRQRRRSSGGRA